jgi:hypothetical protein
VPSPFVRHCWNLAPLDRASVSRTGRSRISRASHLRPI